EWHHGQVRRMFDWAERNACRHRTVAAYFGETIEDCGVSCDVCTGDDILAGEAHPAMTLPTSGEGAAAVVDELRDTPLFEDLRTLRRRLADERGVPAYVVFSDATLLAMAEVRPTTEAGLLAIPGVGPVKLERYSEAFLAVLRDGG
ncbi:MAG: HRDC domain-containing protein, partial [Acidimicrobiia bacterium]